MTEALYSNSWAREALESLDPGLLDTISDLRAHVLGRQIAVKRFNDQWLAVCCGIEVDLPSRGPVNGLDIRSVEPIAFLLHRRDYARRAPDVRSDRPDFPASQLPHLNPTASGNPPSLCLHRGSLDDWFAEHSVADLVDRTRGWLRDAARGRLMREGDLFEHTRLVAPAGAMIFSADTLDALAQRHWNAASGSPGNDLAVVRLSTVPETHMGWDGNVAVQFEWLTHGPPDSETTDLLARWNKLAAQAENVPRMTVALIGWASEQPVERYFGTLPTTYGDLIQFAGTIGIDLPSSMKKYQAAGAQKLAGIPIVLGVRRPRQLIGRDSDIEWLSFVAIGREQDCGDDGTLKPGATVLSLTHRDPLTVSFARGLSGVAPSAAGLAIIGCGALGSKFALHRARSGRPPRSLVDYAAISPHHLVRHGLTSVHVGHNKASALREEILSLFRHSGDSVSIDSHATSILDVLGSSSFLEQTHEILDATASPNVLHVLAAAELPNGARVQRAEIADLGRLGVLSREGPTRNPRVDDLQIALFDEATRDDAVATWLGRHRDEIEGLRGPALEEIGIGIGCSSATMRLRDDVVALHAAAFSAAFDAAPISAGEVLLTKVEWEPFGWSSARIAVPPVRVVTATGERGWSVRISHRAMSLMSGHLQTGGRNERGGLLVGCVHTKRKIVYVSDALPPSRDSRGSPRGFFRGVGEYPKSLARIASRTANLIRYVGEWHTHPHGSTAPSEIDQATLQDLVASLRPAGIPAHILILSHTGIRCHVQF